VIESRVKWKREKEEWKNERYNDREKKRQWEIACKREWDKRNESDWQHVKEVNGENESEKETEWDLRETDRSLRVQWDNEKESAREYNRMNEREREREWKWERE